MTEEKSRKLGETERPSNEVLADPHFNRHSGCLASPRGRFLSEADVIGLIQTSDTEFQVWRNGYERGLIEGSMRQSLDDDALADLAARIAISRVENQNDIRATIRNAIKMIDVLAARATRAKAAAQSSMRKPGAP